jgi:hypothetical protein
MDNIARFPQPLKTQPRISKILLTGSLACIAAFSCLPIIELGPLAMLVPWLVLPSLFHMGLATLAAMESARENYLLAFLSSLSLLVTAYATGAVPLFWIPSYVQPVSAIAGAFVLALCFVCLWTQPRS